MSSSQLEISDEKDTKTSCCNVHHLETLKPTIQCPGCLLNETMIFRKQLQLFSMLFHCVSHRSICQKMSNHQELTRISLNSCSTVGYGINTKHKTLKKNKLLGRTTYHHFKVWNKDMKFKLKDLHCKIFRLQVFISDQVSVSWQNVLTVQIYSYI